MKINLFNNYNDEIKIDYKEAIKVLEDAFNKKFKTKKDVSLILVDLDEIHKINLEYRHIDKPTDVISFEEFEDDYLGEIFICVDKVYLQAKEYGHSNEREFAFLLCHGLLHLHGYDHLTKEDEVVMFNLQDEILDNTIYKRD
ncbi:MAG: rRNA maturation RNase YbeY [Bacilli bacterium]|nr:rRNA maturation RNase YbeY [Bacilli bacterium]